MVIKKAIWINNRVHVRNEYVYARAVYYKLAREFTHSHLKTLVMLVNKDHASVMHGMKVFELLESCHI